VKKFLDLPGCGYGNKLSKDDAQRLIHELVLKEILNESFKITAYGMSSHLSLQFYSLLFSDDILGSTLSTLCVGPKAFEFSRGTAKILMRFRGSGQPKKKVTTPTKQKSQSQVQDSTTSKTKASSDIRCNSC
jgi:hypothetical protein